MKKKKRKKKNITDFFPRKIWTMNPVQRVVPNKKKKILDKSLTKKDIDDLERGVK